MTVLTDELAFPDYDQDAPAGPPEPKQWGTPPQRKRVLKKIRRSRATGMEDWAFVTCESCGWTGFDVHWLTVPVRDGDRVRFADPIVTPCPECGGLYATFAFDY